MPRTSGCSESEIATWWHIETYPGDCRVSLALSGLWEWCCCAFMWNDLWTNTAWHRTVAWKRWRWRKVGCCCEVACLVDLLGSFLWWSRGRWTRRWGGIDFGGDCSRDGYQYHPSRWTLLRCWWSWKIAKSWWLAGTFVQHSSISDCQGWRFDWTWTAKVSRPMYCLECDSAYRRTSVVCKIWDCYSSVLGPHHCGCQEASPPNWWNVSKVAGGGWSNGGNSRNKSSQGVVNSGIECPWRSEVSNVHACVPWYLHQYRCPRTK